MADQEAPKALDQAHFDHVHGMLLQAIDEMRAAQAEAMADAIRSVLRSPEDISAFMDLVALKAQERATAAAGRGVWWVLRVAVSRWLVIGLIVLTMAKMAGWDVAAKVGRWLTGVSS
jgi:hypothetical protein